MVLTPLFRSRPAAPPATPVRSRMGGFTLMELMIVVVIMAILAAIALPSYREYVLRSRLIDATKSLADFHVKMEQFYLDNRTYVGAGGGCGVPDPTATGNESFTIACTGATATAYLVTATGITAKAPGFTYTIDQANTQATGGTAWGKTSTTCWVIRKDGSCS